MLLLSILNIVAHLENLLVGRKYSLGEKALSEQEIIDFALAYDPLDFHINKEVAEKSIFKGLVASGSHVFHWFYKEKWIPLFGKSVLAGLQLNNWKFLLPVYANQTITASASIASIKPSGKHEASIAEWKFEFVNENNNLVQSLELFILHKSSKK